MVLPLRIYRDEIAWHHRARLRFHLASMGNLLFDLFANVATLGAVCFVCLCRNRAWPWLAPLRGARIYTALAAVALTFDAVLTFTVFADVQRYRLYGAAEAFAMRAASTALVASCALTYAAVRHRRAVRDTRKGSADLVITTSPYSDSRLPM
jgi:hypothetical protein